MAYRSNPLYLLNPLFSTPEIQQVMDSYLELWLSKHELRDGARLYHYTTLSGMQGILSERALWCGHSSSLNDPLEIQHGRDTVVDILRDLMEKEDHQELRAFLRTLLVHVEAFGKHMFHVFVACFCESDNLLSQWREYADKGGGYSLGFEFSSSTRVSPDLADLPEGKLPYLRKVIYDEEEQKALVGQYLRKVTEAARTALDGENVVRPPHMPGELGSVMAMQAANVLLDMLLSFKNSAFQSEEEWRLVWVTMGSHQPEKLSFRESASGLVPYRTAYLHDASAAKQAEFPLRSIRFGPTLEPVRTRSAIQLLLHHIAAKDHAIVLTPHIEVSGAGYSLR